MFFLAEKIYNATFFSFKSDYNSLIEKSNWQVIKEKCLVGDNLIKYLLNSRNLKSDLSI